MPLLLFVLWLRGAAAEMSTNPTTAITTTTADPSITCFQEDLKCVAMNDNLIRTYIGITWQECSLLCEDELACETFNFFGQNSDFHPHNACLLFSECENKIASEDCLFGTREPDCDCTSVKYCPCTIEYEGGTDSDNFVDLASEVENEGECKSLCLNTTDCAIFTYFDDQHPFQPNFCLLLKDAGYDKAITKCNHCKTGPATCQYGQKCQAAFLTDGTTEGLVVFAKANSSATLVSAEIDCYMEVRALAIGGGGSVGSYGGGGSGYPEVGLLQLRANEALNLVVGEARQTSLVERDGQVILSAAAGQDSSGSDGGDGYSGGGAGGSSSSYHGQDGGFDGGDGDSYSSNGGKGSGIDVKTLNMTRFVLTPGKAGVGYSYNGGGGGGGILVNGEKPSGGSEHMGEGFGGGGGYGGGFPGCVLIEV